MTYSQDDSGDIARTVFAGLTPNVSIAEAEQRDRVAERSRLARTAFSTGSVLLVGSMAAMTLNLTGPIESADAREPLTPRDATADARKSIRESMAAPAPAVAPRTPVSVVPANYHVQAGDTVSSIAELHGLSTASVLALNGLSWSSLIFPGQKLTLASAERVSTVAPGEVADNGEYLIVAGDTVSAIADRFGVSTLSVLSANGLGWSSIIYPGQTLVIPGLVGPGSVSSDPQVEEEPIVLVADAVDLVVEDTVVVEEPMRSPILVTAPPVETPPAEVIEAPAAPVASTGSYLIQAGDTIGRIANMFGISVQAILDANGLSSSNVIYTGHSIVIPGGSVSAPASSPPPATSGSVTAMTDEMRANAAIIVQVGRELGVPDYGIIVALAAAAQESTLRNLTWGDRDSVGLFQQRPSSGWGTVEQLTTPSYAARLFYGGPSNPNRGRTRGLLEIAGWQSMTVTQAAQKVQISAYPNAYAKWETSARAWFAELG